MVMFSILSSPPITYSLMMFCLKLDFALEYFIFNDIFSRQRRFRRTITYFSPLGGSSATERRRPDPAAETYSLFACKKKKLSLHIKNPSRGLYFEKSNPKRIRSSRVCFTRLHATGAHLSTRRAARERQLSDTGWREADAPLFTGPLTFLRKPPSS